MREQPVSDISSFSGNGSTQFGMIMCSVLNNHDTLSQHNQEIARKSPDASPHAGCD